MSDNTKEQFSLIYDQYVEKIYRFVYLKVDSRETAEDITSSVFMKCWESYQNNQQGIANMNAFLYQIARNMTTDYYREKGKTKVVHADLIGQITDKNANLYEKAVLSSDVEAVKSAIGNLKKDYQDVIIWHYLEDMTVPEICQIIKKSPGAVRVMIHRGLSSLKDQLIQES